MSSNITRLVLLVISSILYNQISCNLVRERRALSQKYVKLWPDAQIPYVMKDDEFCKVGLKLFKKVIQTIEEETCIKFKRLTKPIGKTYKFDYIAVVGNTSKTCYSEVGRTGKGRQDLFLGPLCRSYGQMLHEMVHAVGLMHELMRPDRDKYIKFYNNHVLPDFRREFAIVKENYANTWDRPFDFQSITLYDPFTFSLDGSPVWEPKEKLFNIPLLALSEKDLSYEDARAINKMYKCEDRCKVKPKCRSSQYITHDCRCEKSFLYAHRRCHNDPDEAEYCKTVVEDNHCYDELKYAIPLCRRSCGRCYVSGNFGKTRAPIRQCLDLEENLCPAYVRDGHCYFDGWTKIHCRRSCNLCPPPAVARRQSENSDARLYLEAYNKGLCYNRFDDLQCEIFADGGQCRTNAEFMFSQCSQACGVCQAKGKEDESYLAKHVAPCKNYIDNDRCDALASEGKCNGTTLQQCLASCGKCGPIPAPAKDTATKEPATTTRPDKVKPSDCKDKSTACDWLAQNGRCQTDIDSMSYLCPLACKLCKPPCSDLDEPAVCSDILRRGYCVASEFHRKRCAATCGECQKEIEEAEDDDDEEEMGSDQAEIETTTEEPTTTTSTTTTRRPRWFRRRRPVVVRRTTTPVPTTTTTMKRTTTTAKAVKPSRSSVTVSGLEDDEESEDCTNTKSEKTCSQWERGNFCRYRHIAILCKKSCRLC